MMEEKQRDKEEEVAHIIMQVIVQSFVKDPSEELAQRRANSHTRR